MFSLSLAVLFNFMPSRPIMWFLIGASVGALQSSISKAYFTSDETYIYTYEHANKDADTHMTFSKYDFNLQLQNRIAFWPYWGINDTVGFSGKSNLY